MTTDELAAQELAEPQYRGRRIATTIVSLLLVLLVLFGVAGSIGAVFGPTPYWSGSPGYWISVGTSMAGLAVLSAMPRSTPYMAVVLALVAIPGIVALGFFVLGMLIAWTSGVHTFASSWGPISGAFLLTAPVFAPLLISGLAVLLRERAARVRFLAALGVIAAVLVLLVPGLMRLP